MKICSIGSPRLRMPTASRKKKRKKELNNHLRGNMIKEKRNVIRNDLSLWLFANIMWRLFPYNVFAWYNSVSGLLTGLF